MNSCIFCNIVKGEIPSFKIFENEDVLAFLDINPVTPGHVLVIPKNHFESIFDIDEETLKKIIIAAKHISEKIKNALRADGIRLSQSNGKIAGQDVMHFHLHVIPRYNDDGLSANPVATLHLPEADMEELKQVAEKLK